MSANKSKSKSQSTNTTPAVEPLYLAIREAMEAGLEVTLHPNKDKTVKLTVSQAKQGCGAACEVDLIFFEWAFAGEGIANRINEAVSRL